MPGMSGEDADATGAYHQTDLGPDCPPTWITLPRDQWPKSWYNADGSDKYNNPVVRLVGNLYGHPLAGLYWSQYCQEKVLAAGFTKIHGWECLYSHSKLGLILSVYVDDFKLGGRKQNLSKGWQILKDQGLILDPPVHVNDNVYLGMKQSPCEIPADIIKEKSELFTRIFEKTKTIHQLKIETEADTEEAFSRHTDKTERPTAKKSKKKRKAKEPQATHTQFNNSKPTPKVTGYQYDLTGNCEECILKCLELIENKETN